MNWKFRIFFFNTSKTSRNEHGLIQWGISEHFHVASLFISWCFPPLVTSQLVCRSSLNFRACDTRNTCDLHPVLCGTQTVDTSQIFHTNTHLAEISPAFDRRTNQTIALLHHRNCRCPSDILPQIKWPTLFVCLATLSSDVDICCDNFTHKETQLCIQNSVNGVVVGEDVKKATLKSLLLDWLFTYTERFVLHFKCSNAPVW